MNSLHVIGAGGHAKVVVALAEAAGWHIAGIYDDRPDCPPVLGHRVSGPLDTLKNSCEGEMGILAIGNNAARRALASRFAHLRWPVLRHPHSWVAPTAHLNPGTVVMAGAIVQPDVIIGAHTIVNTAASVDHDCRLGDFVHVAPGARLAGNVLFEDGVFAGAGSVCIPGTTVGAWSVVGAGAVVIRDLPGHVIAAGVVARVLRATDP